LQDFEILLSLEVKPESDFVVTIPEKRTDMESENEQMPLEAKYRDLKDTFDAVFKLTSTASKIIDEDLTILKVNEALTDLLGYRAEEIEGTKIMDYACEAFKHHWSDLQEAMWKHGKPSFKLDACIVKKDGSLAWVHVTTIRFENAGVSYAFTVLDDFSYRKSFEESEKRLRMALHYSKMAVWELDTNSDQIIHSEGLDNIFGYHNRNIRWDKKILLNQFIPEDRDKFNHLLDQLGADSTLSFEARFKTPEGLIKWVYLQGKAEDEPDGKPEKILGTIYDITKEKLAERHKDDFISIASHELRTPITALKASLQLMDKINQTGSSKFTSLVQQANRSMNKISVLIDDLLNASNINEGQLQLKSTRFKISSAIDECCHHVTAAGAFNIIVEGDIEAEVTADSERIQQVVVNFVNNAMKYAPASKDIHIRVTQEEEGIKVSVSDHGPGILDDKIPYIFDRFYRADISGGQYSGLGLGLYISAEIIKKHKGRIGVYNDEQGGSTFWFTLPV
jgi:PAS domain S-box-containing protein